MFCRYCGGPMEFGQKTCPRCKGEQEALIQSNVQMTRKPSSDSREPLPPEDPLPQFRVNVQKQSWKFAEIIWKQSISKILLGSIAILLLLTLILTAVILGRKPDAFQKKEAPLTNPETFSEQVRESETARESEPIQESDSVQESEPIQESDSVQESESVHESEPAHKSDSAQESEPVHESDSDQSEKEGGQETNETAFEQFLEGRQKEI